MRGSRARLGAGALLAVLAASAASAGQERKLRRAARPTAQERAAATGFLLDSPRPAAVVDRSIEIAEKLRRRYGIDTGRPLEDREAAARRAQVEFLERLAFSPEEVASTAERLGLSLDPARCRNWCENARELATLDLKRTALAAFAEGRPWPGTLLEAGAVAPAEEVGSGRTVEEAPED